MDSSKVTELDADNFEKFLATNTLVFVDFWAEWCAPCKAFAKVFNKASENYQNDIAFASVNIENNAGLAEAFNIRSVPHLMVFKERIAIYSESGTLPASTLDELIKQAIDADVSNIKHELEQKT